MLYVKAIDNQIVAYPYSQTDLIRDNPGTSFPAGGISTASLAEWNVFPVHYASQPTFDDLTERLVEAEPIHDGSAWIQQWKITPILQEEIDARNHQQAASVRAQRNALLAATDWWVIQAMEAGQVINTSMTTYRQALRDITSQPGFPWDITWPEVPQ
jgi:hypothetical protein